MSRKGDPELQAQQRVENLVAALPPSGQLRVLRYCLERAYERATGKSATVLAHPHKSEDDTPLVERPRLSF